jgi:molybdopterin-guanine dinucleotide biosynthesis protein A
VASSLPDVTAVVLAGGRARRFDGVDKGLVSLLGKPMIGHVLAILEPQCGGIVISANRNVSVYGALGWPVVRDVSDDFAGPLAGLAAAMAVVQSDWLLLAPCDTPLLPGDLVARLTAAVSVDEADIAMVHDGVRTQPAVALLRRALADDLAAYLAAGERKIDRWYRRHRVVEADFSDCADCFVNVNSAVERDALEQLLHRVGTDDHG